MRGFIGVLAACVVSADNKIPSSMFLCILFVSGQAYWKGNQTVVPLLFSAKDMQVICHLGKVKQSKNPEHSFMVPPISLMQNQLHSSTLSTRKMSSTQPQSIRGFHTMQISARMHSIVKIVGYGAFRYGQEG